MMKKRMQIIVGIDEAGRGPLAGPVVAAAVFVSDMAKIKNKVLIKDSKQMTTRQRQAVYQFLKSQPQVEWGLGRVGERVIDKINILQASKLAMVRAVKNLEKKLGKSADLLLIDGNFALGLPHQQSSIIKGDATVPIISLASIVAKVSRDALMIKKHKIYPQYGFNLHKGYPTKQHYIQLNAFGPCRLHRKTFAPVRRVLQK